MRMITLHYLWNRGDLYPACGTVGGIGSFGTWDRKEFKKALQPCQKCDKIIKSGRRKKVIA